METINITHEELVALYDDMLDEQGDLNIGGISFTPSYALKELDPIAYECGLGDYYDSLTYDNYRCEEME